MYCHGLFVLCGETNIQLPRRGLYLRCEMSFKISSGIIPSSSIHCRCMHDQREIKAFKFMQVCIALQELFLGQISRETNDAVSRPPLQQIFSCCCMQP